MIMIQQYVIPSFSSIRKCGHISSYIFSSNHILYNHITLFCLNKRDLKANCRCNDVQALLSPNQHKTRLGRKIHVKGEMSEINDYSNLAFLQVGQNWREQKPFSHCILQVSLQNHQFFAMYKTNLAGVKNNLFYLNQNSKLKKKFTQEKLILLEYAYLHIMSLLSNFMTLC